MKKQSPLPFILFFCLLIGACSTTPNPQKGLSLKQQELLMGRCETFFNGLKAKKFHEVWGILTLKSKMKISKEVADNVNKALNISVSEEEIFKDFETGGPYSRAYWEAYVANFDPDMALKESKWEVGQVKEEYAEVILRYKTAERPAILKLYKEGGEWRFGLVETFWTRK